MTTDLTKAVDTPPGSPERRRARVQALLDRLEAERQSRCLDCDGSYGGGPNSKDWVHMTAEECRVDDQPCRAPNDHHPHNPPHPDPVADDLRWLLKRDANLDIAIGQLEEFEGEYGLQSFIEKLR